MHENEFQEWFNHEYTAHPSAWTKQQIKKAYVAGAEMMKKKIVNEANGPILDHNKMG